MNTNENIGKRVYIFNMTGYPFRPNTSKEYTIIAVKPMNEVNDHYDHYVVKADDGEEIEVNECDVVILPNEKTENICQRIYDFLKDNDVYAEVYDNGMESLCVSISWGDWKHEHGWCSDLMGYIGYSEGDMVVTEEDGSDCYSADHYFYKMV